MGRIIQFKDLKQELQSIRNHGGKIILAGGCFDIIHKGHLEFFKKAKEQDGKLFLILESDENVRRFKGEGRPVHPQEDRARILSHIPAVDYIVCIPPFTSDREYFDLVKMIEPDIIAITHGDRLIEKKKKQADEVGAQLVEVLSRLEDYSTTKLIKSL